jgi:hypothetical protein
MMRHLANRPAAGAVWGVELLVVQSGDGFSEVGRGGGDLVDPRFPIFVGEFDVTGVNFPMGNRSSICVIGPPAIRSSIQSCPI